MRIKSLKLLNFRNYKELNLDFSEGINIFIGENGVGKTNILEAIYVLSLTKSNRYGTNLDLINHQEESTSLIGEVDYLDYLKRYQVDISKNSKKVYINNQEIKRITDYISNFCVTTFMPSDIDIIKGSPSTRRNLLNIQIGELYNNYLKYVNEYNSLLKIRNDYLKKLNINGNMDFKYLEVIDQKMIEISLKIYYFRYFYVSEINKIIPVVFKKITNISNLQLEYVNNLNLETYDEDKIKDLLKNKFKKNLNKEIILGMTLNGVHRDDLIFKINSYDAKIYASEGQQKMIVIAYKISELLLFKKIKREYPVLLLDDVFSEIDVKKRNNIIKYLKSDIQVIITTNDILNIDKSLVDEAKIFKIKNGNIKTKGGVKNVRRKSNKSL
ncbi:MAG: DNA replication/repair protein RecF [Erysipelotrichaceae bacterium]|nr:DNA replication/repair protein RecF [Erysipelotrichaceae bacterium]